jgi:hypothetical protein
VVLNLLARRTDSGGPALAHQGSGPNPNLAVRLERAFDSVRPDALALANALSQTEGAQFSHSAALVPNVSDLPAMLAWSHVAKGLAAEAETFTVACGDPWLFRHLAGMPGITATDPAPSLWQAEMRSGIRGRIARLAATIRFAQAKARLAGDAAAIRTGGAWLLCYGHPASDAHGSDAYFGRLMIDLPHLRRVLHVDAGLSRVRQLASSRTVSLHAFGAADALYSLPSARWRTDGAGEYRWLIRRAVVNESGTGQAAAIAWQMACQSSWLRAVRPKVVAWPWENHTWERALVHDARRLGTRTVGYAHVPFNAREWNFGTDTLPDGVDGLPDTLVACGDAGRERLISWGAPPDRVIVAGALRFEAPKPLRHDADGPVFVALPANAAIAQELAGAAAALARAGKAVLVRPHPLAPVALSPQSAIKIADRPLNEQGPLSAVVYASTTVGLEAIAGGLPTIRFLPDSAIGWAAPDGVPAPPAADTAGLLRAVESTRPPAAVDWNRLAAPPDMDTWRRVLQP